MWVYPWITIDGEYSDRGRTNSDHQIDKDGIDAWERVGGGWREDDRYEDRRDRDKSTVGVDHHGDAGGWVHNGGHVLIFGIFLCDYIK